MYKKINALAIGLLLGSFLINLTDAAPAPKPHLTVLSSDRDHVLLTVTNAGGKRFVIQSLSGWQTDSTWITITKSLRDNGSNNTIILSPPPGLNRFYRAKNDVGENVGGTVFDPSRIAVVKLSVTELNLGILKSTQLQNDGGFAGSADSSYVPCTLDFDGMLLTNIAIRFKGNASFNRTGSSDPYYKPYKLDFNHYTKGLDLRGLKKLNLHVANSTVTNAALNDYLAYGAFRDFGTPAPRTGWAEVSLNGRTLGLYTTVEQVDEEFLNRNFETSKGNLYKPDLPDGGLDWAGASITNYPSIGFAQGSDTHHTNLLALIHTINHQPVARFREVVDVDSVLAYHAGNVALANWDTYSSLGHNYYLYEANGGRFYMFPWDVNESMGVTTNIWTSEISPLIRSLLPGTNSVSTNSLPPNFPTNGIPGGTLTFGSTNRPLTTRLVGSEPYRSRYLEILESFLTGPASKASMSNRIAKAESVLGNWIHPAEIATAQSNLANRIHLQREEILRARRLISPP